MKLQSISFTVNRSVLGVDTQKMNGREYLVAPVVMIKSGVLSGNNGAILYTNSTVNRQVDRWNSVPLVLGHPEDGNGNKVSARDPNILDRYGIGFVFNTQFSGDTLSASAWFDSKLLSEKSPKLYRQLKDGVEPIELSTGLFTRTVNREGNYNGTPYNQILSEYYPDHLAILEHEEGACSLKDGCGVLVANCGCGCDQCKGKKPKEAPLTKNKKRKQFQVNKNTKFVFQR